MRSKTLAGPNNTFTHTFAKPGTYHYNCGIQPLHARLRRGDGMNPANPDDAFNGELSRRRFLRHAAWAGAAVAVHRLRRRGDEHVLHHGSSTPKAEDFSFVQISDSHIGFTGAANPDVTKTFQSAIDLVNGLPARPDFVVHTGDLTHYSTNEQFDQVKQMLSTLRTGQVLVLPGEHDSTDDTGEKYRQFFGAGTQGDGWFSFDHRGAALRLALVNTINLQKLGHLGPDQAGLARRRPQAG